MELMSNNHSVFNIHYHLILVTKYRKNAIDDNVSNRLKDIFIYIGNSYHITLEEWNHDKDHIHIAKELKKFKYSSVEKGQTSKKYGNSIQWLIDSGLVNPSYATHEPLIPLLGNCNKDQFKLYFNDTGLLLQSYGFETKKALLSNTILGNAKGGIYENVVSELLVKKGYKLYYFRPSENQEIEFLLEKDGKVAPLEVKAGNSASISLNNYLNKYKAAEGYKLINGNIGVDGNKIILPHYMVMFL